nr:FG-GAP-like repeat-containing protein [Microvirga sp. ACRRW]
MFVGDLNGDGVDDFFSGNSGYDKPPFPGERNTLMLSSGKKLVNASSTLPSRNEFTHSVTGGDIDNDGDIDLFVGVMGWNEFGPYLLINDGKGRFTQNDSFIPDAIGKGFNFDATHSVPVAKFVDINADGFLDLVAGFSEASEKAGVAYLNDGTGHFMPESASYLPTGVFGAKNTIVTDIVGVDVNRDGYNDIVLSTTGGDREKGNWYRGQKLQVLINDGTGHFRDETSARVKQNGKGNWNQSIKAVDVDNDGDKDIVAQSDDVGGPLSKQTVVWINSGGKFTPAPASMLKGFKGTVVPVDFNKDGRMDFLSLRQEGRHSDTWSFSTHLNTSKKAAYLWGTDYRDNLKGDNSGNKISGGTGNDTLTGGKGKDAFLFDAPLRRNVDRITDFSVKDDSIWLDNAFFQGIGAGAPAKPRKMAADMFKFYGQEGDAKIVYNKASGGLYYDADGSGPGGMIKFAQITKNLKLTAADFFVI